MSASHRNFLGKEVIDMSFIQQAPRSFTRQDIEALNAKQIGVYGLFKQNEWVYIGKGDIRQRLLDHLNGDNPSITRQGPTHWLAEKTNGDPSAREEQLILEHRPTCNRRVG